MTITIKGVDFEIRKLKWGEKRKIEEATGKFISEMGEDDTERVVSMVLDMVLSDEDKKKLDDMEIMDAMKVGIEIIKISYLDEELKKK